MLKLTVRANAHSELAQLPMTVFKDEIFLTTVSLTGADKEWQTVEVQLGHIEKDAVKVAFFFGQGGMEIESCQVVRADGMC